MNNTRKWASGIALSLLVLLVLGVAWRLLVPFPASGMVPYSHGWQVPMMYPGNGMMGIGMLFMGLTWLGFLVLIGLGIAWLVKSLTAPAGDNT